jgi:hypothetical protein
MHTRRLRAPSPAFVISLIALFIALGGTTYAATSLRPNSVGTRQLKKNAVTSSKIKNRAVTAAKINPAGLIVANAAHATSADSATNATNATNANSLGGVSASNYLQNNGNIYFQLGHANWEPFKSSDPIVVTRGNATQGLTSSSAQQIFFTLDMAMPDGLYGKALAYDGVRICYHTTTGNEIFQVSVWRGTQTTDGAGGASLISNDITTRTDAACRVYTPASPITLTSADQLSISVGADWTTTGTTLDLGNATAILSPTSTTETTRKRVTGGQTARR